jgi:hypothetical protein
MLPRICANPARYLGAPRVCLVLALLSCYTSQLVLSRGTIMLAAGEAKWRCERVKHPYAGPGLLAAPCRGGARVFY